MLPGENSVNKLIIIIIINSRKHKVLKVTTDSPEPLLPAPPTCGAESNPGHRKLMETQQLKAGDTGP